jgi:hypothetical protein
MARLYANENFPQPVVIRLRELGHDVLTVMETGKSEQAWPDVAVLAFATEQGRAVLTLNRRHFVKLHDEQPKHGGIVACTFDPEFPRQATRIHEAIESEIKLEGKLVRVNRPAT